MAQILMRHQEAVMYSPFAYEIAQNRVADAHRQARHDAMVRQAGQGRPARKRPSQRLSRRPAVVVRRALTAWGAHT